ncbi:3'-5' exoribonuclease HELZ2 [Rhinoraja longicauda]
MKSLEELWRDLDLQLICTQCSEQKNESTFVLKNVNHKCQHLHLVARKNQGSWKLIRRRPPYFNPPKYDICRFYIEGFGCRRHGNNCTFAWSKEEALVWIFEKDHKSLRNILKNLVAERTNNTRLGTSCAKKQTVEEEIVNEFEGQFVEICAVCFDMTPQRITSQRSNGFCCEQPQHTWRPLLVCIQVGTYDMVKCDEIRPVPSKVTFQYCDKIKWGELCRQDSNHCSLAHSEVELMVWKSESQQGLKRSTLLQVSQQRNWNGQPDVEQVTENNVQFYCKLCLVTFLSQDGFQNHCYSIEHGQMLLTDTTVDWKHRKPPLKRKHFQLCSRKDICELGDNCNYAHTREELEEWLTRSKIGQNQQKEAEKQGLISFRDRLLEEYRNCGNEVLIMTEKVDGITVTCDRNLRAPPYKKKIKLNWLFKIQSQKTLLNVALLKREPGANFSLEAEGLPKDCFGAEGKKFQSSKSLYFVNVSFKAVNIGFYKQWVVFDFGHRPHLVQKICIGEEDRPQKDKNLTNGFQSDHLERWNSGNRRIIPCMERSEHEHLVLQKYKQPAISLEYETKDMAKVPISLANYGKRMHNFLDQEEQAEADIVSRLNRKVDISITDTLEGTGEGMKIAQSGELFAVLPTPSALANSNEGYLFKRAVKTALLAPNPSSNDDVYEAAIIQGATSESRVALNLSVRCLKELGFLKGSSHAVEIQFQLDRFAFCFKHQAVDKLQNKQIIFPDFTRCSIPQFPDARPNGNQKQCDALAFITGQVSGHRRVPPLLIYGPFGTGKTFTLAKAAMEIVKRPGSRLLLCTDTNSAADLYVKDYFHQFVSEFPEGRPLRLKYVKQNPIHTDPITKQYCLLSDNAFTVPDRPTLESYRIVITTCMEAKLFSELKLPLGFFTHILIDEASQMLECDAIIPLGIAGDKTRVVLAGDHLQMTPRLFSVEDREMPDHTLLNRLFQYYKRAEHGVADKSRIIFNVNYRSVKEIIDFVSVHFYVGETDIIKAGGNIPSHPEFYPLMFCHVAGKASFNSFNLSWYNEFEVLQVVEKVNSVVNGWPVEWGPLELKEICVVSSETYQIQCLRQKLRSSRLGSITVENVFNIQGKQFRVIIISTVHTCESSMSSKSVSLEFFSQLNVLNTAMTRAQSLVIVVGDAVALCSVGNCSKIWKKYVQESIDNRGFYPQELSMEQIRQAIVDNECLTSKDEDVSDNDSEKEIDLILQELLDESKNMALIVTDEGLMDIAKPEEEVQGNVSCSAHAMSFQKRFAVQYEDHPAETLATWLLNEPTKYKRCEVVKETFHKGYAIALDDLQVAHIKIEGRANFGKSFPGDQVLVEILPQSSEQGDDSNVNGKVVGILRSGDLPRVFVCRIDEYDPQVMVPINKCVTKIYTPEKTSNTISIRKRKKGKYVTDSAIALTEKIRKDFFVVEILCWRENFFYPLGIVTKTLPAALTMDRGMEILNLEYLVHESFPEEVMQELEAHCQEPRKYPGENRTDCRDYVTFTVDPKDSKDLDDAISVRDLGECYEIGVHIADVAAFVPSGSSIDQEAQRRGVTYYQPAGDPFHMLPPKLSQDLCTLLPGEDRKVISLFVEVNKSTDRIVKTNFSLSLARSDKKLTYEQAEEYIKDFSGSELRFETLEDSIAVAFHFSRVHRKCRLQDGYYYDKPDDHRHLGNRRSHQMIEELMIMMNNTVAEFLTNGSKTMNVTPLRCQGPPDPRKITTLKEKHKNLVNLSIHLSHHLEVRPDFQPPSCEEFQILSSVWNGLVKAAEDNDINRLIDFIATDDIHPNLAPVSLELRRIMLKSFVIRSNSTSLSKQGHYSLHLESYTWATSPIRRYPDIIIQRLLTQILCQGDIAYNPQEIDKLCIDFNRKKRRASNYEKIAQTLHLATQLQNQVIQKMAFAFNVAPLSRHFGVLFPMSSDALQVIQSINYRTLQLVAQPTFNKETKVMQLKWRKRVYSLDTSRQAFLPPGPFCNPYINTINSDTWQEFVKAVRLDEYSKVSILVLEESQCSKSTVAAQANFGKIEASKGNPSHHVTISLNVRNGDALQLQLTKGEEKGFLVPAVQLFKVTRMFEICVEHAENPVPCFSEYASKSPKNTYQDIKEYQAIWGPLCAMECVTSAVAENEVIIIYGVKIAWARKGPQSGTLHGTFSIPKEFCMKWQIKSALSKCYFCIRCRDLKQNIDGYLPQNEGTLHQSLKGLNNSGNSPELNIDPNRYIWVAHAVAEEFSNDGKKSDRNDDIKTNFTVHQMPMDTIPKEIYQKDTTFVVEVIPKQLPEIRKEQAIQNLPNASSLAQDIALGRRTNFPNATFETVQRKKRKELHSYNIPNMPNLNPSQVTAVRSALQNAFTLIQGPPGTGKTMVGVHIVYWFHQMNLATSVSTPLPGTDGPKGSCILYCGPSNKSVNVVAEYLLKLRTELRPLRVYSEQMEMVDFPYPGSTLQISRRSVRETKPKPELRPITLHYRIREKTNPYGNEIRAFDAKFKNETEVTEEELYFYKKLLDKARKHELQNHDVILCTCATSSSQGLQKIRMRQILVDESAMCTEPELLIPIVAHKQADQIVLLGDHMQLRPIVSNEFCRRLGLEKSLFERYERQFHVGLLLDVQYRMHEEICQFPSEQFYEGRLKTDENISRRPRSVFCHSGKNSCPIIFGHVEGNEISLMVSTEEGNENSKANQTEADRTVSIVSQLLNHKINPKDIAILTPYNAQVMEISKLLKAKGIADVTVCTIVKSQGSEWRYVIFSVVRSLPKKDIETRPSKSWLKKYLGFTFDPNQVNVALTRAKEGLCIFGNEHLLSTSFLWKELLAHYRRNKSLVKAEDIVVKSKTSLTR